MKTKLVIILAAFFLAVIPMDLALAQVYVAPEVVVSKEKVRSGGKVYYSHVVLERQTLYSISKAYGVTIEEIYAANPTLKLETEGLKKDQILLIPIKENVPAEPAPAEPVQEVNPPSGNAPEETVTAPGQGEQVPVVEDEGYFIHRVKWFEDLDAIARKYGVSKESIMNINRLTSEKIRRKQELKIPRDPSAWEGNSVKPEPSDNGNVTETPVEAADTTVAEKPVEEDDLDDIFVREGRHDVSVSMLIPFSSTKTGDRTSFMDFYCGALLAARSLGNDGVNLDIHTYDVGAGNMPVTYERFAASDFTIGPVSSQDIIKASSISEGDAWIVSPLDMQVEPLADSLSRLIQAPTPTSVQVRDMVEWIKSDTQPGDKVLVVTPSNPASEYLDMVERYMSEAGVTHVTTTLGSMQSKLVGNGVNRVALACEYTERSTVFLIEALRNLYMASSKNHEIVLYSTSRIRTYDQIEVEQLHKVNLHASVTYFVDYNDKKVSDFLLQYRALYNTEPSRSAYSGYDLMSYFSTLAHKYGKRWPRALNRVDYTGLQSDFNLVKTPSGSYINNAVRRVVYNPDFSVTLVR